MSQHSKSSIQKPLHFEVYIFCGEVKAAATSPTFRDLLPDESSARKRQTVVPFIARASIMTVYINMDS
jgi:hypothetical protein